MGRWPRAYIKVGIGVPWTSQRVLLCYALGRSSQWRLGIRVSPIKKCEAPASHGLVHDFHEARTWAKVRILEGFWAKSWKILSSWCILHLNFHISFMTIYDIVFFLTPYLRESLWIMSPFSLSFRTCWPSWTFVVQLGAVAWHQPQGQNHIDGSTRRYRNDTERSQAQTGKSLFSMQRLNSLTTGLIGCSRVKTWDSKINLIDCTINDPSLEEDFVHGSDIKNVSWHIVRRGPVLLKKYSQPDTHPNLDLVKECQGPFKDPMSQFPQYFPLLHTFKWPPALCSHCFP